ncbi:hypothetical protein ACIBF7_42820 [Nonomuraea sp. NPDC050478]|uniref:hypothetical protein n=1 Tax=Nonomuraea sp. NPDC050478 TaxID=3364365 RepID=UPI0037A72B60
MRAQMKTAFCGLALGLAALAAPAAAQPTGMRATAIMDDPCGHFTQNGTEYYRNCKDTSEKIWVTYRISAHNQHFCVPAQKKVELGYYLNVYGVYHDSWNC